MSAASAGSQFAEYVQHGLALCPIASGSKGPRTQGWQLADHAVRDADAAAKMSGAGLLHAWSRTCAVDVDDLHGATEYLAAHGIDLAALLAHDEAVQIRSGRPNRAKLIYLLPAGCEPLPMRKIERDGAVLLELRCASADGQSVQDVLPPTVHPDTGKPYEWAGSGDWRNLPELPIPLLNLWRSLQAEPAKAGKAPAPGEPIGPGQRNDAMFKIACKLRGADFPEATILAALQAENRDRCKPPLTDEELRGIARSAGRYEAGTPSDTGDAEPSDDPLAALGRFFVTDEQVQAMQRTRMIWRDIIAMSHIGVWSAPGNGGKTSLATFAAGELADEFEVLFFQEDASAGDLPALHQHATRHGYRLLNSTLAGASPEEQIKVLRGLTQGCADLAGYVMFFDTLKKYTDLMSKGGTRAFFQLMRALTQRGATVVLLGHTNKHKGVDGKLIFEGVGDVRNDVDELLYIDATEKDPDGVVTLTIRPDKTRCKVREATFTLDTKTMRVRALDQVVNVAAIVDRQRRQEADAPLIEQIRQALSKGGSNYTDLLDRVAKASDKSRRVVRDVLDRYCSEDLDNPDALWIETRMRLNNTRHIALKPRVAA